MALNTGKLLLLFPPLILLISGCTTTSTVETGNGVVIKEFGPAFSQVYPNEPIIFDLKMKNTGSVNAEGVFAEILGIDQDWYDESFTSGGPWLGGEKLPDQDECRYNEEHGDLLAPNEEYGTEGEVMTCTWTYKAPNLPLGTKTSYDIWARVFYTYSSITIKSITAGSQEQIRTYIDQGKTIPVSTVSKTRSPIELSFSTQEPIRYWEGKTQIPITIGIKNIGGGTPCKKDKCKDREGFEESWGKIDVKVGLTEGMTLLGDCADFTGGKELLILPNQENKVVCSLELTDLDMTGLEQRMISLSAEYSYFIDSASSITIL